MLNVDNKMSRYLLLLLLFLVGCISTPDYISPEHASFDNGVANSGIICITLQIPNDVLKQLDEEDIKIVNSYISEQGQGFIISANFVDRYNALIKDNNKSTKLESDKIKDSLGVFPIIKNKYYFANKDCLDTFIKLNDKQRILYNLESKKK